MTAHIKVFIILVIFAITSFVFAGISSAQTNLTPSTETDFARDVRMGIDQTASDSAASALQNDIEENQIVEGKISTSTGVDVVEVIQSMDQSDLNEDFTPTEEMSQNDTGEKIEIKQDMRTINPTEKMTY